MNDYIFWNTLFEYVISKNIIPGGTTSTATAGVDVFVMTPFSITKNGTAVSFDELTTIEQGVVLAQLESDLMIYRSLISYTRDKMTYTELDNFLASGIYTNVSIEQVNGESCFNVLWK